MSFANASQQIQKVIPMYGNVNRSYPTIDWIVDVSNANLSVRGLSSDTFDAPTGPGKVRTVKLTYFPINCAGVAEDCTASVCDDGTIVEPKQINYTIGRCTASKNFSLLADDLRLVDGNWTFSDVGLEILMHALPDWRKAFAQEVLSIISASAGLHNNGAALQEIIVTDPISGRINPAGLYRIDREFADAGFTTQPFILGNYAVDNWKRGVMIGSGNLDGQDIGKLNADRLFYDGLVDTTLGNTNIFGADPRVIKLVTFNRNSGLFQTIYNGPADFDQQFSRGNVSSIKGTFYDPITRLNLDFTARYNDCTDDNIDRWNFQISLQWDIFIMPDINCNDVAGVNGIYHYSTCAEVQAACETGTAYPTPGSPATAQTYSANPTISYPFLLSELNVAGYQTTPNVTITDDADLVAALNDGSQFTFTLSGSNIQYSGFYAITANVNGGGGANTITFS